MSELKAKHVVDVYDEYSANPYKEAQVYLKDEADKVIRHHKYKRCLAMADYCQGQKKYWHMRYTTAAGYDRSYEKWKHKLLIKWYKRWLELAEKFKETK